MAWSDFFEVDQEITAALLSFDWATVAKVAGKVAGRIRSEADAMPLPIAKPLLLKLRRKSRFEIIAQLAGELIRSGQNEFYVRRQHAQALIDLGYLYPAEKLLETLAVDARGTFEEDEARGLLGRVSKQSYVNGGDSSRGRISLKRAADYYAAPWNENPAKNTWHGINLVALLFRAHLDGVSWPGMPDPDAIARRILEILREREKTSDTVDRFDLATAMEAHIALGQNDAALDYAGRFTSDLEADAFEIGGTLRQMTEVWKLTASEEPGKRLLPVLRAALIARQGGLVKVSAAQAKLDARPEIGENLERLFGADRFLPLKSYQLGLERAKSIVRIERANGQPQGTGWLVDAGDFFEARKGTLLVVTNHHVVSDFPGALRVDQARGNLQMLNQTLAFDEILYTSPVDQLDVSLLSLKAAPAGAVPLPLCRTPFGMCEPPPRLFIIGHPGGRDLEFSLEDSLLIGCNDRLLHYRAPTEGGSSGSPVFEDQEWKVVALHHKGGDQIQRIDGSPGFYQANEGIRLEAIQKAIAAHA